MRNPILAAVFFINVLGCVSDPVVMMKDAGPATPIPVVRDPSAAGHPAIGSTVTIADAIVTGVKSTGTTHGFFVQDRTATSWGGVYVFVGPATVSVAPGAVVTASGVYKLFRGFEQIDVSGGSLMQTGTAAIPTPVEVTVAEVHEGGARAIELQSMLLRVKSVVTTVATAGVDFTVTPQQGGMETLVVTSYMANDVGASPFVSMVGQKYSSITGFGYKSGSTDTNAITKLAPLAPADLISP